MPVRGRSSDDPPKRAYYVTLKGRIYRDFLVYADTAKEAEALMRGPRDPRRCQVMDDSFEEVGITRARRAPTEDPEPMSGDAS